MPGGTTAGRRCHVVLVPGFAGFDALGQLEYYAGVTPLFRRWQKRRAGRAHVVLHYFDNFPTAAVATRAGRLRGYLAKRIARGEFLPGDAVALVGHSTGGLDIRWLLWQLLQAPPQQAFPVDGGKGAAFTVTAREILRPLHRVVFLSVPQWGTNMADWVRSYALGRAIVVAELRAAVTSSQLPLLDKLDNWIAAAGVQLTGVDLLRALRDALREADARTAQAHEAASQLELWLRHIASDFSAINDLAAKAPPRGPTSPAHFTAAMRTEEQALWKQRGIRSCSYATLGRPPFHFKEGSPAPPWDLLNPWTYPARATGTDIVYRTCYRACAGGPFRHPASGGVPTLPCLSDAQRRQIERWHPDRRIELWDNDGIVNTASMLWPDGPKTLLVPGDHMDITGHFKLVEAIPGEGRKYQAYDLLNSGSGFRQSTFDEVWHDVFDFCAARTGR